MAAAGLAVLPLLGPHRLQALSVSWHGRIDAMTLGIWCADGLLSVDDPQFQSSFTDVYNADSLQV